MSLVLQFLSLLAICAIAGFWYWLWRSFRTLHVPLILFNLTVGLGGSASANRRLWRSLRSCCVERPLVLASLMTGLLWLLADGPVQARWRGVLTEALTRPGVAIATPLLLLAVGALILLRGDILDAARGRRAAAPVAVDGAAATVVPVRPRNLIIIQMESLEATFGRADLFGRDLLQPLTALPGHSFAALRPSPGASWTTSSMMATLLGVPFRPRLALGQWLRRRPAGPFAPELVGFADVLKQHGYSAVAMQGATVTFHGFGDLFRQHGFDRVLGAEDLLARGAAGLSSWGLYDDDLFDAAREELAALRAAGRSYCLYIVTSDTHAPRGEASPRLRRASGRRSLPDIIAYNAGVAARFVDEVVASGGLADTRVAIIGDHLMPETSALPQLRRRGGRTIFNRFISADPPLPERAEIEQTDLAATLLTFAGFAIADGRLGLGRSGFRSAAPTGGRSAPVTPDGPARPLPVAAMAGAIAPV